MTSRQLVSSIIALAVCVPLYWFGRSYIPEDVLSWLIILIALPLLAIGFFHFNGMPFEKFIVAWLKFEILFPRKRKFKTENAFRAWQNEAIEEEKPKGSRARKRAMREKRDENLEKTFLLAEAEANGTATYSTDPNAEKAYTYDVDEQELLTVRKSKNSGGKNKRTTKRTISRIRKRPRENPVCKLRQKKLNRSVRKIQNMFLQRKSSILLPSGTKRKSS